MELVIKSFNELTTKELYQILKVRSEVFVVEQTCIYLDIDSKDEKSTHLYYIENGEIVSYLRVLPKGVSYDEVSIGRVLTKENYRGKGLSNKLLLKAIEYIKENKLDSDIRISAQAHLVDFYKSVGFEVVSEEYLEDNIPHIEMLNKIK